MGHLDHCVFYIYRPQNPCTSTMFCELTFGNFPFEYADLMKGWNISLYIKSINLPYACIFLILLWDNKRLTYQVDYVLNSCFFHGALHATWSTLVALTSRKNPSILFQDPS